MKQLNITIVVVVVVVVVGGGVVVVVVVVVVVAICLSLRQYSVEMPFRCKSNTLPQSSSST